MAGRAENDDQPVAVGGMSCWALAESASDAATRAQMASLQTDAATPVELCMRRLKSKALASASY